jgi:hypothetical protein
MQLALFKRKNQTSKAALAGASNGVFKFAPRWNFHAHKPWITF